MTAAVVGAGPGGRAQAPLPGGRQESAVVLKSVSIQLMWAGLPFPERVARAAAAGFDLVDLWDQRNSDIHAVHDACQVHGIGINGFFATRDTSLCDPGSRTAVLDEIKANLDVAVAVGARQMHCFSNAIRPGGIVAVAPPLAPEALMESCAEALSAAADLVAGTGVQLVLEHLNTVFLPGYLWDDVNMTAGLARLINRPEIGVVFDTYHQQLTYGRLTDSLVACLPQLARVDLAEVPGRFEPGQGEIDMAYLLRILAEHGWDKTVTFETTPSDGNPETALAAINTLMPLR
ncbi:MAG: TIM barrel protein [Actinobacteria bacterium]|nr:TIM barrel protein [Actinomycetota bacterium]